MVSKALGQIWVGRRLAEILDQTDQVAPVRMTKSSMANSRKSMIKNNFLMFFY
jgi:hypothetical protein